MASSGEDSGLSALVPSTIYHEQPVLQSSWAHVACVLRTTTLQESKDNGDSGGWDMIKDERQEVPEPQCHLGVHTPRKPHAAPECKAQNGA